MAKNNRVVRTVKRILFGVSPWLAARLGIKFQMTTADRYFLEGELFAHINAQFGPNGNILFIGIDRYNWHYPRLLKGNFLNHTGCDSDIHETGFRLHRPS